MGQALQGRDRTLPFVGSDKIIYAMDGVFKYMLHTTLEIQGRLDQPTLAKAINFALDKSPILRSVARLRTFASYWKPLEDVSPYRMLTVRDLSAEPDTEAATRELLDSYINESIDVTQAPPIGFLLLVLPGEKSLFVIKVHHCVADPVAMMYCLEDIQEAYGKLLNGEPLPDIGGMEDRSRKRLFRHVSPLQWGRVIWRAAMKAVRSRGSRPRSFVQFANPQPMGAISYRVLEFKDRDFTAFRSRCKAFGVTANELVMAALCRTIRLWNGDREQPDGAYSIVMPVDLRWYARQRGKAPRIMASFIGGSWVTIPVSEVTTFEAAVQYVVKETRFIKDHHLGLLANVGFPLLYLISPRWLRRAARRQYERNPSKMIPTAVFAYLGKMDRTLPGFPGCQLTQMTGIGAGFYPVGLDVVVLNFERTFNITVTYLKHACSDAEMDQFMALFAQEILGMNRAS